MNKHESSSNLIVGIIILGVVLCLLKDFISIKSYKLPIGAGEEGKFYSGILLDGYNCPQYSTNQVRFKWSDFDCGGYHPESVLVDIIDKTETINNFVCEGEIEEFYRDKVYKYYFDCEKSKEVLVKYDNGYTESVKVALIYGHIAIADLDTYKIEYKKEMIK